MVKWVTTTDHKVIGNLYFITSFVFFLIGGLLALLIRAELVEPGLQVVDNPEQYNQLFTMHGTIMLLLFATPLFAGFANALMPMQIGAPDVAFPRLNMFAYWLYLFGGLIASAGFLTPQGAAAFGWFAYAPLSDTSYSPGPRRRPVGLRAGAGRLRHDPRCGQLHHHDHLHARPRHDDVPDADVHLDRPRHLDPGADGLPGARRRAAGAGRRPHASGPTSSTPTNGGAMLWQHLFWFFGHPEVYIIALPFFGIISEILPVFSPQAALRLQDAGASRRSRIAALSVSVWAHHMYATGQVLLPFFAIMTMLIAVPTGVKFFNWIGTMWGGSLTFETPMLWAIGFLVTFLFGGLTGIILSSPALDFHLSDSYFVVAHFHYVVFGTVVFAMFAGFYFWWPKFTGRMLDETLGKIHFWMLFIGFHTTFLIQHWLGVIGHAAPLRGLPARGRLHLDEPGLHAPARSCSAPRRCRSCTTSGRPGAPRRWSRPTTRGATARSLEWATSCPPPRHNFESIPRIRSERPAFDLHHPEVAALDHPIADKGVLDSLLGEPDLDDEGDLSAAARRQHGRHKTDERGAEHEGRVLAVRRRARSSSRRSASSTASSRTGTSRSASSACSSRPGCRRWSASTSGGPPASWTTGPRTTRPRRSRRPRASTASSARTAGGRCRWPRVPR